MMKLSKMELRLNNGKIALRVMALAFVMAMVSPVLALADDEDNTIRDERNFIRSGNSLYEEKRYAEAEVEYKKALEANPNSEIATFNLAAALLKQANVSDTNDANNPMAQASTLLGNLVKTSNNDDLVSKAYYNLGNIAFHQKDYGQSIEMYKNSLRRNPDDDLARENLRLAQKMLQQQQQDQSEKDQQDQEQEQEQQQQKQQQQQNQQNQDKKEQQQQQQQQNSNQQQQQGMSQENIDQILKAMQDAEQSTQQRVNEEKAKEEERTRSRTDKNW